MEVDGAKIFPVIFDEAHSTFGCDIYPKIPFENESIFTPTNIVRGITPQGVAVEVLITQHGDIFEIGTALETNSGNSAVEILRTVRMRQLNVEPTVQEGSSSSGSSGSTTGGVPVFERLPQLGTYIIKHFTPRAFLHQRQFLENPESDITVTQFFTNTNRNCNHGFYNQHPNTLHCLVCCVCDKQSLSMQLESPFVPLACCTPEDLVQQQQQQAEAMDVDEEENENNDNEEVDETDGRTKAYPKRKRIKLNLADRTHHVYQVMPCYEGGDLVDYIARNGTLLEDEAKSMLRDLVQGLSWMHRFGIAHRDFSPENILFDTVQRKWVIIDYGLAYRCRRHFQEHVIWKGQSYSNFPSDEEIGCHNRHIQPLSHPPVVVKDYVPHYCWVGGLPHVGKDNCLAPEIWEAEQDLIQPMLLDVWVLGIMLCIAVFGGRPLESGDPNKLYEDPETGYSEPCPYFQLVRAKALDTMYIDPYTGMPMGSPELFDLIHQLLSVNPRERPSFEEILAHPWMQA